MKQDLVGIRQDTARYYLRLEAAFEAMLRKAMQVSPETFEHLVGDPIIKEQLAVDPNEGYGFRCDLHDAWAQVLRRRPPRIQKQDGPQKG